MKRYVFTTIVDNVLSNIEFEDGKIIVQAQTLILGHGGLIQTW
jgi:hypothetical protein